MGCASDCWPLTCAAVALRVFLETTRARAPGFCAQTTMVPASPPRLLLLSEG